MNKKIEIGHFENVVISRTFLGSRGGEGVTSVLEVERSVVDGNIMMSC